MSKKSKAKQSDIIKQTLDLLGSEDQDTLRSLLQEMHPSDIADLLEATPSEKRDYVWSQVNPDRTGEVLVELIGSVRADLVQQINQDALVRAARSLDTDDIADLLPVLSEEAVSRLLYALNEQDRRHLDELLSYPEDTAGGLMNVDVITIREDITNGVVWRYLRMLGRLPEDTNKLFVVNRDGQIIGTILITDILLKEPELQVKDFMTTEFISFNAMTPDKDVALAFSKYNLISAPVVNENSRLLGRITIDDVVDVLREEADHSVMAPAGLREDEDIFAPVSRSTKNRSLWLGVNLATAVLASWVIGQFEETIERVVALAVLMPIVASMGGNAGIQTVTLVVRGLALGTVTQGNARRVLIRELMIGVLNSMVWAAVVSLIAILWYKSTALGMVIAMAMAINLVFAAVAGVLIPVVVERMGIDPALASGVALTTVTDVVGFFAFLSLAAVFLL